MEILPLRLALTILAITWSAVIFIASGAAALKNKDPALIFLRVPLIPEILYTVLELIFLLVSLKAFAAPAGLNTVAQTIRLSMGLACIFFCYCHYRANGISRAGLIPINVFVVATLINYGLFALGLIFPHLESIVRIINALILSATFLYAGLSAILAVIKQKDLYLSSWAGFWIAVFCLSFYPFVGAVDALSLTIPFLDSTRSVSLQLCPVNFLVILTIATVYLFKIQRSDARLYRKPVQALSDREKDVTMLMRTGKSNKQIAEALGISLSTVKSHAASILKKYCISSRSDLPALIADEETTE